jgi:hypothetical protein
VLAINIILSIEFAFLPKAYKDFSFTEINCSPFSAGKPFDMKKYLTEKNALTVMTSLFCLIMTIVAASKQSFWEAIAFALAFSFSVELICHRAKEN